MGVVFRAGQQLRPLLNFFFPRVYKVTDMLCFVPVLLRCDVGIVMILVEEVPDSALMAKKKKKKKKISGQKKVMCHVLIMILPIPMVAT